MQFVCSRSRSSIGVLLVELEVRCQLHNSEEHNALVQGVALCNVQSIPGSDLFEQLMCSCYFFLLFYPFLIMSRVQVMALMASTVISGAVAATHLIPAQGLTGNGSIVLSESNFEVMDFMVKKFCKFLFIFELRIIIM